MANIVNHLLDLPRFMKRGIVMVVDVSLCIITVWLSLYLRLGEFVQLQGTYFIGTLLSIFIAVPIFISFGLYNAIFRYTAFPALWALSKALFIYLVIYSASIIVLSMPGFPRTIAFIQPVLLFIFVGLSRFLAYYWIGRTYQFQAGVGQRERALIYGAGDTGRQLAQSLFGRPEMKAVAFIDDDPALIGQNLFGMPILGSDQLLQTIAKFNVNLVLLALPRINSRRRLEIINNVSSAKIAVRTLPSLIDITTGKLQVSDIQDLDINDLLSREPIEPDESLMAEKISGCVVMVTGAGGSIGSELCRQIINFEPAVLILLECNEFSLYQINEDLLAIKNFKKNIKTNIVPILGSVCDQSCVHYVFENWKIDTIYHAAAYKHVPLVESNPEVGLANNAIGTLTMVKFAEQYFVKNFVLISTDKAVRPTNIMGASKRLAELILQARALAQTTTCFSMVRFGNVLGSSGSVVPKFKEQILRGGPVTVTHPEVTRFFMTIPEAAQLVLQSGSMASGGDVFLLDMGEPIKIADLARRMIELSGHSVIDEDNPEGDIGIDYVGLRPGEKLYEELLLGNDPSPTSHPKIMRAHEIKLEWAVLEPLLDELSILLKGNQRESIKKFLLSLPLEYKPE